MKNYLIKFLGGYTENEMHNVIEAMKQRNRDELKQLINIKKLFYDTKSTK